MSRREKRLYNVFVKALFSDGTCVQWFTHKNKFKKKKKGAKK